MEPQWNLSGTPGERQRNLSGTSVEPQWNFSGTSAEPQWKMLFVSRLYHDGDQHTVSLAPTYFGELGANLLLFFSVHIDVGQARASILPQ